MKYVVTALISVLAPFLLAHPLVLAPRGTPSPPSVQAGPALSSGTRCRHSASAGEAKKKKKEKKKWWHRKDFIRLKRSTEFPPFIMSRPPGGGQRPRPTQSVL